MLQPPFAQPGTSQLSQNQNPKIVIVEQPAEAVDRFRYRREKRKAIIRGVHYTVEVKTFPTIQLVNYDGKWKFKVTCVTIENPLM